MWRAGRTSPASTRICCWRSSADPPPATARRAFDETDWSVNRELRVRCLLQLQEAIEAEVEELRSELVAKVGTPVAVTYMAQLDWPLADAFRWPAKMISEFEWERRLPSAKVRYQ
jgi:aldehyde dehydrogenase (NAD+)